MVAPIEPATWTRFCTSPRLTRAPVHIGSTRRGAQCDSYFCDTIQIYISAASGDGLQRIAAAGCSGVCVCTSAICLGCKTLHSQQVGLRCSRHSSGEYTQWLQCSSAPLPCAFRYVSAWCRYYALAVQGFSAPLRPNGKLNAMLGAECTRLLCQGAAVVTSPVTR